MKKKMGGRGGKKREKKKCDERKERDMTTERIMMEKIKREVRGVIKREKGRENKTLKQGRNKMRGRKCK